MQGTRRTRSPTARPAGEDYLAAVLGQTNKVGPSAVNAAITYAQYPTYYDPNAAPMTGGNILNPGSFGQKEGPVLEYF